MTKKLFQHLFRIICNTLCIGSAILVAVFVLFLLFNRPDSYTDYYETVHSRDRDPGTSPRFALCLSLPFKESRLRDLRIPSRLASFLLYSLSPFYARSEMLEEKEMLADLTGQYRRLVSR